MSHIRRLNIDNLFAEIHGRQYFKIAVQVTANLNAIVFQIFADRLFINKHKRIEAYERRTKQSNYRNQSHTTRASVHQSKMDQILLAFFYLAQTIRYEGELSAATINATLTHFLAPNEIHAKLEKYPKPEDLSFRSDEPAVKKDKN